MTLERLKAAIERAEVAPGTPIKFVAIDGRGGAGKTSLASKLANLIKAEIIHTDDFASWDNPLDWWPRLVEDVLDPIKNGAKQLNYERGAWYKNHNPKPMVNQPVTPIMLLEGVSASRKEFRPYLSFAIWVEVPKSIYQARGIARDLASNSDKKSEEELRQTWDKLHIYEEDYVKRDHPKEYADIIVDGTKEL